MDIEYLATTSKQSLEELQGGLQSASSGTVEQKLRQVAHCERLAQKVRFNLDSYKLDMRDLLGADLEYHTHRLQSFEDDLRQCRTRIEWKRLEAEPPKPDVFGKHGEDEEAGGPSLDQVAQLAEQAQDATKKSVSRSMKMVAQAEEQGSAILLKLEEQDAKFDSIHNEMQDVKQTIRRNKKLLGQIMRSARSDRCIQMLCVLVTIALMVCLVLAVTGKDDGKLDVPEGIRQEGAG